MKVAVGLLRRGGQVLIAQRREFRDFPLTWEFPGGKVESGESLSDALIRELEEELCIIPTVGVELLHVPYPHNPSVELHFFSVVSFEGIPTMKDHNGLIWVDLIDVQKYALINNSMLLAVGAALSREQ